MCVRSYNNNNNNNYYYYYSCKRNKYVLGSIDDSAARALNSCR